MNFVRKYLFQNAWKVAYARVLIMQRVQMAIFVKNRNVLMCVGL